MPRPLTPDHYTAGEVVRLLGLEPLDREGGFFRRTAASSLMLPMAAALVLGGRSRRAYSVIYFLITPEGFSALHRLATDEIWCFHAGDSLESLRLMPQGADWVRLGPDPAAGERLQDVVPAHCWQGTRLAGNGRWALASLVVAPEFDWSGFELGDRAALTAEYPAFAPGIAALTRERPVAGAK